MPARGLQGLLLMKSVYLLCGIAALVSAPVLATPQTPVTIIQITDDGPPNTPSVQTGSQTVSGGTAYGDVSAFVDFGVLKVGSSLSGVPGPAGFKSHTIGVSASVADYMTVNAPAGVTSGGFLVHLFVNGALNTATSNTFTGPPHGTGGGEYSSTTGAVSFYLADAGITLFDLRASASTYGGSFSTSSATLNGNPVAGNPFVDYTFIVGFDNLDPIPFVLTASCSNFGITLEAGQTASGSCALDHSIYWGGISNPVDQNGDPIANFSVGSGSGFNYNNASPLYVPPSPAPEPASWALLIAGFGLTGAALRRRRAVVAV